MDSTLEMVSRKKLRIRSYSCRAGDVGVRAIAG